MCVCGQRSCHLSSLLFFSHADTMTLAFIDKSTKPQTARGGAALITNTYILIQFKCNFFIETERTVVVVAAAAAVLADVTLVV